VKIPLTIVEVPDGSIAVVLLIVTEDVSMDLSPVGFYYYHQII
jgi:hypothetical protein